MPVIAGVLLGLALVVLLLGFHVGPHAHLVAGVLAGVAAAWIVVRIADGQAAPALWAVVGAAIVLVVIAGVTAWLGMSGRGTVDYDPHRLEGLEGVAVGELAPDGRVRVRGELWAATSVNGTAPPGSRIQVLRVTGLHLQVWAEEPDLGIGDGRPAAG